MKSAQNAGTGATAYGIGSLTANNMTLVNGPTWGAGGLAFVPGSSQYATIADFLASETLTVFARVNKAENNTADTYIFGQWDTGANSRSFAFAQRGTVTGDPLSLLRSTDGTFATGGEAYDDAKTGMGSDTCYVTQWVDGGGRSLWAGKTALTLALGAGSARTSRFSSSVNFTFSCFLNSGTPTGFSQQTGTALAFLTGTVTETQRETLTDLINAL
jgi:hypothetical protein